MLLLLRKPLQALHSLVHVLRLTAAQPSEQCAMADTRCQRTCIHWWKPVCQGPVLGGGRLSRPEQIPHKRCSCAPPQDIISIVQRLLKAVGAQVRVAALELEAP